MRSDVEDRNHEVIENQDVGRWNQVHGGGIDPAANVLIRVVEAILPGLGKINQFRPSVGVLVKDTRRPT